MRALGIGPARPGEEPDPAADPGRLRGAEARGAEVEEVDLCSFELPYWEERGGREPRQPGRSRPESRRWRQRRQVGRVVHAVPLQLRQALRVGRVERLPRQGAVAEDGLDPPSRLREC